MNNFASYIEDLELRLEDLKTLRITFSGDYEEGRRDMLTNIIAELKQVAKQSPPKDCVRPTD
jgi:hypothetical protein